MKNTFVRNCACLVIGFAVFSQLNAQRTKGKFTANFEDGTSVEYDLLRNHPDELFSKHISVLSLANDIGFTNEISFSGIVPGRFSYKAGLYAGLQTGFGGITLGGTWYLLSTDKPIQQSVTVKSQSSGNTTTKYVVKVDATKGKYFGINAELGYNNIGYGDVPAEYSLNNGIYNIDKVSYGVVALGIGYNSFRGAEVKVKESHGGYIGGTRLFTAVADVAFFPAMTVKSTPLDSIANTHVLAKEDITNGGVGFRGYVQGQTTFTYHKRNGAPNGFMGIMWRLGVMKSAYMRSTGVSLAEGKIVPMLGLGLFYTFH